MKINLKNFLQLMGLALSISLAACTAITGKESAGEYLDDSVITARVKAAIVEEPTLSAFQIGVETLQNEVQLSGFVDSSQQKSKAGQIARNTKGVRSVKNDLRVRR